MGANYIEANEAVSKKDFRLRIKICRKEAKESGYWLKLLDTNGNKNFEMIRLALEPEERELVNMFGSILRKTE
ncbi:MAG: four helix bundle protein [Deltaproteobacteria bacterium]|nr:four helix bundle protein [Deltaproteobacteria bacterium]